MMPHTVPNRPTKGAVAPIVASTPVPRVMRRAGCRLDPRQPRGDPLLHPVAADMVERAAESPTSSPAACTSKRPAPPLRRARGWPPPGCARCRARTARRRLARPKLDDLRQPHRPGDERSEGEADHHRLHDDVGSHEHAPRRQIVRQGELGRRPGGGLSAVGSSWSLRNARRSHGRNLRQDRRRRGRCVRWPGHRRRRRGLLLRRTLSRS